MYIYGFVSHTTKDICVNIQAFAQQRINVCVFQRQRLLEERRSEKRERERASARNWNFEFTSI